MGVWVLVEMRIGCQIPRAIVADIKTYLMWMLGPECRACGRTAALSVVGHAGNSQHWGGCSRGVQWVRSLSGLWRETLSKVFNVMLKYLVYIIVPDGEYS